MCKAFESNPPLPEDEPQAEASEEPAPQPSPLKRKGKEVALEVPRKKSKPSAHTGGDLKIGAHNSAQRRLVSGLGLPVGRSN